MTARAWKTAGLTLAGAAVGVGTVWGLGWWLIGYQENSLEFIWEGLKSLQHQVGVPVQRDEFAPIALLGMAVLLPGFWSSLALIQGLGSPERRMRWTRQALFAAMGSSMMAVQMVLLMAVLFYSDWAQGLGGEWVAYLPLAVWALGWCGFWSWRTMLLD